MRFRHPSPPPEKPAEISNCLRTLTLLRKLTIMILSFIQQDHPGGVRSSRLRVRALVSLYALGLMERAVAIHAAGGIFSFLIREAVTWQQRPWPVSLAK